MTDPSIWQGLRGNSLCWLPSKDVKAASDLFRSGFLAGRLAAHDSKPLSFCAICDEGAWVIELKGWSGDILSILNDNDDKEVAQLTLTGSLEGKWIFASGAKFRLESSGFFHNRCNIITSNDSLLLSYSPLPLSLRSFFQSCASITVENESLSCPELPVLLFSTWVAVQKQAMATSL